MSRTFEALLAALLLVACTPLGRTAPQTAAAELDGTSWQLVQFQSSDDKLLIPDDRAKYTIALRPTAR